MHRWLCNMLLGMRTRMGLFASDNRETLEPTLEIAGIEVPWYITTYRMHMGTIADYESRKIHIHYIINRIVVVYSTNITKLDQHFSIIQIFWKESYSKYSLTYNQSHKFFIFLIINKFKIYCLKFLFFETSFYLKFICFIKF